MFPRGYTRTAIVFFFVGIGFDLWGVAGLVIGTTSQLPYRGALLWFLFWGFTFLGIGGFLSIWALIEGRRPEADSSG